MKLSVLGYGHTVCGPQWQVRTSGEGFQRVYYVLGGCCRCTIEGRTFQLLPGYLYVLPQYVPYAMSHDPSEPFSVLWQHIRLADRDTGPHIVCRKVENSSASWHILAAMAVLTRGMLVEEAEGSGDAMVRQLRTLMESLLTLLDQEEPLFTQVDPRLSSVMHMIAENPDAHYTVQDLANIARLERSHFSRLFRTQFRVPAQTFLIRWRLDQAAQLLLREVSVSEAAEAAGYADPKAFSRAFSARFGVSPAQYRKYHILQP